MDSLIGVLSGILESGKRKNKGIGIFYVPISHEGNMDLGLQRLMRLRSVLFTSSYIRPKTSNPVYIPLSIPIPDIALLSNPPPVQNNIILRILDCLQSMCDSNNSRFLHFLSQNLLNLQGRLVVD